MHTNTARNGSRALPVLRLKVGAQTAYWQSGGMEAMASSEPHARFFFAGVSPCRAWFRTQSPSLLAK